MLQVIAICSCISAVCLWCGFVTVCCPRLLNRISKLSGQRFNRCSRRSKNRSQDQLKVITDEKLLIKDTKELQIDEEETELLKSGDEEKMNSGTELSSLMIMKMRNEIRDNETKIETKIENLSKKNSQQINIDKKKSDIFSYDVDSKRKKLSKKSEPRVSIKMDNYTSVTSTLSNLSKTSNETSQANSENEKKIDGLKI